MVRIARTMVVLAVLLLFTTVFSSSDELYDVRQAHWGMTPQEVMAREASKPVDKGPKEYFSDTLTYRGKFSGIKANITYYFFEDRLVKVDYDFTSAHANGKAYLEDFDKVRSLETRELGPPELEESEWFNSMFERHPDHYGTAVSLGHLKRAATWDTPVSDIKLTIEGEDFEVHMSMVYKSKEFQDLTGERDADIR